MGSGLEHLLAEGIISEIIARLKSGKEAEVYVVRYGGKVVAAKVYKDRSLRSFKNNAAYKDGRAVRNTRSQRAMDRGTRFGQAAAEDAWKSAEVNALYKLHAAGVRVPTPVMYLEGVLLMELVLDSEGQAAPRVIDTTLTVAQANMAYRDMVSQLVRILSCDLIHGDLSPYNVLWGHFGPTIIDFPQIISASHNSRSEEFFLRDARNILGHFASIDRSLNARSGDAFEIWRAYMRRELTPDFFPQGRPRPPAHGPRPRAHEPNPRVHAHRDARPPHDTHVRGPRRPDEGQHAPPRAAGTGAPKPEPAHGRRPGPPRRPQQGPEVIVRANRSPPAAAARPEPRDDRKATAPEASTPRRRPNRRWRAG